MYGDRIYLIYKLTDSLIATMNDTYSMNGKQTHRLTHN